MNKRPNIIFIMADQLAAAFLGCYGSRVNSTPVLDKMAAEGTLFTRNYATCPVCAPNRATLLTGRSPEIHGVVTNNYALSTDTPTYAHVLKRQGYRTGGFGKFHQTPMGKEVPESLDFLGFDESVSAEDTKWGPWLDWVKEKSPENYNYALAMTWPHGERKIDQDTIDLQQKVKKELLQPRRENSEWVNMYTSPLPAELHDTTYITELGLQFMKKHMEKYSDQPFLCQISYVDPHDPYDPPEPYANMFQPEDMPEALPRMWDQDEYPTLKRAINSLAFEKIADNPKAIKKLRALYHGSLKFMDDQIARIVDYVRENNMLEDTIIIFTTDHGDMMGDHSLLTKGVKHYDKGIRCPLIVYGAGINRQITGRLTCSLDFFPAFCEWACVPPEDMPPLEGKSFAGICKGQSEAKPWEEVCVAFYGVVSIITGDGWRLTRFTDDDRGHLFNLNTDPDEQSNLYYDRRYEEKKVKLLERLVKISTRSHDIPQYRNMPLYEGIKYHPAGWGFRNGIKHYLNEYGSPALRNCLEMESQKQGIYFTTLFMGNTLEEK